MFPGFLGFSAPVSVTPALVVIAVPATVVHRASACRVIRGTRVPVWKIEGSIEADYQASLETAQNPDGEPYPAFANDKSWDETSGKAGSGKKFCHSVILGTDSTAQPSIAAIITPVTHLCVTVWKLMKIWQTWDQIRSQFQSLYTADELLKAFTGTTDWVANLFRIAWSSVA